MAFKPNELGLGLNHGIVCPTEPISCTGVCLGMASNAAKADLSSALRRPGFPFSERPNRVRYVKGLPFSLYIRGGAQPDKILGHLVRTDHHLFQRETHFRMTPRPPEDAADSVGTGAGNELQPPHSLPVIFRKNHGSIQNIMFHPRCHDGSARSPPADALRDLRAL